MGDNQKEVPSSNFDLTGDGSAMYDSDSQLRTAIIQRLLNEYRTPNYVITNAMQSSFLRFFIHDSYSSVSSPEYNRPKSDSNFYEPKNNDHIKIEELNLSGKSNESCFDNKFINMNERRNETMYGSSKSKKLLKNNNESFRSESGSISTNNSYREESVLLTGQTMNVNYDSSSDDSQNEFKFVDIEMNNQIQLFEDKESSVKSTGSSDEDTHQNFTSFYSGWKKINKSKDKTQQSVHSSRRGEKTISCSFNDSNRSSIDNYNNDTNNSSDRKESNCNKGKCKPSELATKDIADKKSNNNDEYKIPSRRETKWQVFCELYKELSGSSKEQNINSDTSTESIQSRVKYYDSRKTSSHSSLERKINAAINKFKVKAPSAKTKKMLKNNENFRLKLNNDKFHYTDDTSSDTEEVQVRNRYMRNKRIYNTKKYITNKFRKVARKRRTPIESSTTSSDDLDFFTSRTKNDTLLERHENSPYHEFDQTKKDFESSNKMTQLQQKSVESTQFQQKSAENTSKITQFQQKYTDNSKKKTQLQQNSAKNYEKMTQFQQKSAENSQKIAQYHQKSIENIQKMTQLQQKSAENTQKITQKSAENTKHHQIICPKTSHRMNDQLIHETIFEISDEEPYLRPTYFQTFMDKCNKNYEVIHKKGSTNLAAKRCHEESSTITCDDYSKNNQSFNPNETSCVQANNSNLSIDNIANSGHSTSSFDSIDDKSLPLPCLVNNLKDTQQKQPENLTKKSTSTICLKSALDSGISTFVTEINPIENVFIIKKPDKTNKFDEITVAPKCDASNSSTEWSKICNAKLTVSKLPFRFSSSSKSKSSSENEETSKCKQKMRVIFKREATVIDLYDRISREKTPVLRLNEKNCLDLEKKKRFHFFRNLFLCCRQ